MHPTVNIRLTTDADPLDMGAQREIERGELVVLGSEIWPALVRPVHFMNVRHTERLRGAAAIFVQWVLVQAGLRNSTP